ncbi:MAG: dihydroorotate dehydrogenase electron transfer subunit [Bacteroidales bacterium]
MAKQICDFQVVENKKLRNDYFILELLAPGSLPDIQPGQFVQALVENSPGTFLRRPLSIHDVDEAKNMIKLLVQVVGPGTATLSNLRESDSLNLVLPLGNSFSDPAPDDRILLVGGGCGVAPLLYLAKTLVAKGHKPEILMGFRNKERVIEYEEYEKLGKVWLTTEDGSAGEKGFVTNHPVLERENFSRIYCCGPDPMMKAVAYHSRSKGIVCEVSLENLMACGFGVCLCCVVNTVKGNLCSCTDGPVFNIEDLKW